MHLNINIVMQRHNHIHTFSLSLLGRTSEKNKYLEYSGVYIDVSTSPGTLSVVLDLLTIIMLSCLKQMNILTQISKCIHAYLLPLFSHKLELRVPVFLNISFYNSSRTQIPRLLLNLSNCLTYKAFVKMSASCSSVVTCSTITTLSSTRSLASRSQLASANVFPALRVDVVASHNELFSGRLPVSYSCVFFTRFCFKLDFVINMKIVDN